MSAGGPTQILIDAIHGRGSTGEGVVAKLDGVSNSHLATLAMVGGTVIRVMANVVGYIPASIAWVVYAISKNNKAMSAAGDVLAFRALCWYAFYPAAYAFVALKPAEEITPAQQDDARQSADSDPETLLNLASETHQDTDLESETPPEPEPETPPEPEPETPPEPEPKTPPASTPETPSVPSKPSPQPKSQQNQGGGSGPAEPPQQNSSGGPGPAEPPPASNPSKPPPQNPSGGPGPAKPPRKQDPYVNRLEGDTQATEPLTPWVLTQGDVVRKHFGGKIPDEKEDPVARARYDALCELGAEFAAYQKELIGQTNLVSRSMVQSRFAQAQTDVLKNIKNLEIMQKLQEETARGGTTSDELSVKMGDLGRLYEAKNQLQLALDQQKKYDEVVGLGTKLGISHDAAKEFIKQFERVCASLKRGGSASGKLTNAEEEAGYNYVKLFRDNVAKFAIQISTFHAEITPPKSQESDLPEIEAVLVILDGLLKQLLLDKWNEYKRTDALVQNAITECKNKRNFKVVKEFESLLVMADDIRSVVGRFIRANVAQPFFVVLATKDLEPFIADARLLVDRADKLLRNPADTKMGQLEAQIAQLTAALGGPEEIARLENLLVIADCPKNPVGCSQTAGYFGKIKELYAPHLEAEPGKGPTAPAADARAKGPLESLVPTTEAGKSLKISAMDLKTHISNMNIDGRDLDDDDASTYEQVAVCIIAVREANPSGPVTVDMLRSKPELLKNLSDARKNGVKENDQLEKMAEILNSPMGLSARTLLDILFDSDPDSW